MAEKKMFYTTISHIGQISALGTDDFITRIFLPGTDIPNSAVQKNEKSSSANKIMEMLFEEIQDYFSGKRKYFTVPYKILTGTAFQKLVWNAISEIPYGETVSYKEIAQRIGRPAACRAVGNALGENPLPLLIPCHRVISMGNTLGGFSSSMEIKKYLLNLEQENVE